MNNPLMLHSFTRTLKLKIKPNAYAWLNAAAIEVNQVWNSINTIAKVTHRPCVDDYGTMVYPRRLSGFDLVNRTSGTTRYMDHIGADTIQRVCTEYGAKLKAAFPKQQLSWRSSKGARRSLGWVPFRAASIRRRSKMLRFCGQSFRVFDREYLGDYKFKDGCFAQDAIGDWYLCVPVEMQAEQSNATHEAVGIDLGLKTIATTSDCDTLEAGHWTQHYASQLATAQRRGHKKQAKRIHRKIARCRADALHKFSRSIVDRYQTIVVGDVSSIKLAKTKMAKSVMDSGWGMLKAQLQYKGQQAGRSVSVVSERYTSVTCSSCGSRSGPSGVNGLSVRSWICSECGDSHDRDVNAARNILTGSRCGPPFAGTSQHKAWASGQITVRSAKADSSCRALRASLSSLAARG